MKVILTQDVDNLGELGEVVTVKPGYGRNFLIPRGLARIATASAVKSLQEEHRQAARKRTREVEDRKDLAAELEKVEVVIFARVGEENRIFGTVTPTQVAVQLAAQGFDIDRRKIEMTEDIRMIGVYTASVKLGPDTTAQVKVRVEPDQDVEE